MQRPLAKPLATALALLAAALLPAAGGSTLLQGLQDVPETPACAPHPLIRITEEHGPQGFTWTNPVTGETEHRPGSGVVAGDGSEADPYVIRGWCIVAPREEHHNQSTGIYIEGTDAHVRVAENVLAGPPDSLVLNVLAGSTGIWVESASNLALANNTIVNTATGVILHEADHWSATGNLIRPIFYGIEADRTKDGLVTGNRVVDAIFSGVFLLNGRDHVVQDNLLRGNGFGVLDHDHHTLVANNTLEENVLAIQDRGTGTTIRGNDITGTPGPAIQVGFGEDQRVVQNTIEGNDWIGVRVSMKADDALVTNNTITNNGGPAVEVSQSWPRLVFVRDPQPPTGVTVRGNNLAGNDGPGLLAKNLSEPPDATDNWWGASDGPSGGVTDACTGTVADGSGASITATNATVCFDPWKTSPSSTAENI